MSILFRRRIKIIPGVRLNISKSGLSASVGVRGASVTLGGRGGTYANLGIPGTGIYTRKKIGGKESNPRLENNNQDNFYEDAQNIPDEVFVSAEPFEITSTGLQVLKDAVIEANNQRNLLSKDLKKIKKKIFFTKILKLISQISLIYFVGPIKKRIKENLKQLDIATKQIKEGIENSYVDLDLNLNEKAEKEYKKVINSFKKLTTSHFIWDITSATDVDMVRERTSAAYTYERRKSDLSLQELPGIKSSFEGCCFKNQNGADIYIYPGFLVMYNSETNFGIVELKEVEMLFNESNFIESEQQPNDSEVIKYVWEKTNKNGTRDKRYADNRELPLMRYGEITFYKKTGIFEKFMFSNYEYSEQFISDINFFIDSI